MAKKVRKVKKQKPSSTTVTSAAAVEAEKQVVVEKAAARTPRMTSDELFEMEYVYVEQDLKHVLLLSGAMFVLLIVLNLVLG
jgi:hypothetical protein